MQIQGVRAFPKGCGRVGGAALCNTVVGCVRMRACLLSRVHCPRTDSKLRFAGIGGCKLSIRISYHVKKHSKLL